jgi:hypothetical protein
MKRTALIGLLLLSPMAFTCSADTVFSQQPSASGGIIPSAWLDPNGSDADMYAYDSFIIASNTPITEVRWRGGYLYGAPYGRVWDFTVTFFESIAGGSQPHVNNPQLPEIYLAKFMVGTNAGETAAGVVGGTQMYDYAYTLPTPFQALAGVKYWVRIEASQIGYPDWGLAAATNGDSQHFGFSAGAARFFYSFGDEAFTLLAPPGPYFSVATSPSPSVGGSTSGDGLYTNGSSVTVVATANPGYAFVNWTRDGTQVGTAASYTFTLTTNRTLVANFASAFSITTSASPSAGGMTMGDGSYIYGASVSVSATASANYTFVNWTENGMPASTASNYAFNAGASRALVANFVPANPNISTAYTQPHDGSGAIYKSSWYAPNGLDGDEYAYDSFICSSNQPITKIRWRGGYTNYKQGAGKSPVYDFTIDIYPSIPAGIQPDIIAGPLVTYSVGGNAGETPAGTFGGIDMYDYEFVLPTAFNAVAGTKYWLKLYASQGVTPTYGWPPDWGFAGGTGGNGSRFDEITGGSLAGGTLYYIAGGDIAFTLLGPAAGDAISTFASPSYGGSVSGAGVYASGASVTVSAVPATGHVFVNWNDSGVPVSTASNYTFTATANRTLVANFAEPYSITTGVSPIGGGLTGGDGTYFGGSNVTVVATAGPGYTFIDWTEGGFEVSTVPTYYFIADSSRSLVANFARVYNISTSVSPANSGFTSGGGPCIAGAWVSLAPTPATGYAFVNWREGGVPVCNWPNYAFSAGANRSLVAHFALACAITTTAVSTNGFAMGDGTFPSGSSVIAIATPRTGSSFVNWTENGAPVSTQASYSVIASTNRSLVANFTPDVTSAVFDFDTSTPTLTNTQTLPFDQASGGVIAHFRSPQDGAFSVQDDSSLGWRLPKFASHYLFPRLSVSTLEIQFSQPLSSIALSFGTLDFQDVVSPSTLRLTAYLDSTNTPAVGVVSAQGLYNAGDTLPMGSLRLNAARPFNLVTLQVQSGLADFGVDNIVVTTIPKLLVRKTTNAAVVSWPGPTPGFVLERNSACHTTNWWCDTNTISLVGTNNQVILSPCSDTAFFRLHHQ